MFVTTPNLVFISNVIVVTFAFGIICNVALAFSVVNASNYVWWNDFPLHFILPFLFPNLEEFCDWWSSITTSPLKFRNYCNINIKFVIMCKVQRPMRSRECVQLWNTFSQMGENAKDRTQWFPSALPLWESMQKS